MSYPIGSEPSEKRVFPGIVPQVKKEGGEEAKVQLDASRMREPPSAGGRPPAAGEVKTPIIERQGKESQVALEDQFLSKLLTDIKERKALFGVVSGVADFQIVSDTSQRGHEPTILVYNFQYNKDESILTLRFYLDYMFSRGTLSLSPSHHAWQLSLSGERAKKFVEECFALYEKSKNKHLTSFTTLL